MSSFKLLVLCLAMVAVRVSGSPSQDNIQQPFHSNLGNKQNLAPNSGNIQDVLLAAPLGNQQQEAALTTHYPYQTGNMKPSSIYQIQNPSSLNYGNREVSGWSSNIPESPLPYFGISAGIDYLFSVYIGPVVWCIFGLMAMFGFTTAASRLLAGSDFFGMFGSTKDAGAAARSLDLDNVTRIVHQALDAYMDKQG